MIEAVYRILYFLDDPAGVFRGDIPENMKFHLYTEDESEQPIPGSRADWSQLFEWLRYVESEDEPAESHDSV